MNILSSILILFLVDEEVAVLYSHQGNLTAMRSIPHREVSKRLVDILDELGRESGIWIADLSHIACTVGPGPFATLRSMVSVINGMNMVLQKPLMPLDTLQVLAGTYNGHTHSDATQKRVLYQGFCGTVYYRHVDDTTSVVQQGLLSIEEYAVQFPYTSHAVYLGPGVEVYRSVLSERAFVLPDAAHVYAAPSFSALARHVFSQLCAGEGALQAELYPYYGAEPYSLLRKGSDGQARL